MSLRNDLAMLGDRFLLNGGWKYHKRKITMFIKRNSKSFNALELEASDNVLLNIFQPSE